MDHKYTVCIDIETTGTEAEQHSIFQIGAVIVDTDFKVIGATNLHLKPLDSAWDKRAEEVHGVKPWEADEMGGEPDKILAVFEHWAQSVTGDSRPTLASWGTYFDIAFLKKTYERLNRKWVWQRKCIDLKTIAWWEMSRHGETIDGVAGTMEKVGLPFLGKQHDGFDDILNTVSMLNILNSRRNDLSAKGDYKTRIKVDFTRNTNQTGTVKIEPPLDAKDSSHESGLQCGEAQHADFGPDELTKYDLDIMPIGKIIGRGVFEDTDGCLGIKNDSINWVALKVWKGWKIFISERSDSPKTLLKNRFIVRKLVPCTDDALHIYQSEE